MEQLDGILKIVDNELEAVNKNGKFRSREEIDSVYKLMDIVKDIYCVWQYEDESSDYSEYGNMAYDRGGRSYRGNSYDDGRSYARGRGRNAKRDSMGRYSRDDGMGGNSYRSYRSNGYSRDDGKEEYIENLREMMHDAPDDQTRQSIQRMIQQMEQG